jgi:hypothetical protein
MFRNSLQVFNYGQALQVYRYFHPQFSGREGELARRFQLRVLSVKRSLIGYILSAHRHIGADKTEKVFLTKRRREEEAL